MPGDNYGVNEYYVFVPFIPVYYILQLQFIRFAIFEVSI